MTKDNQSDCSDISIIGISLIEYQPERKVLSQKKISDIFRNFEGYIFKDMNESAIRNVEMCFGVT